MPMQKKMGHDLDNLYYIPDGAVVFSQASEKKLDYRVQINDLRLPDYHRNNGVTKFMVKNSKVKEKEMLIPYMRVSEG